MIVNVVAETPLNFTPVTDVNPVPFIVTVEPTTPEEGEKLVNVVAALIVTAIAFELLGQEVAGEFGNVIEKEVIVPTSEANRS